VTAVERQLPRLPAHAAVLWRRIVAAPLAGR
jgi:hypothetical protein